MDCYRWLLSSGTKAAAAEENIRFSVECEWEWPINFAKIRLKITMIHLITHCLPAFANAYTIPSSIGTMVCALLRARVTSPLCRSRKRENENPTQLNRIDRFSLFTSILILNLSNLLRKIHFSEGNTIFSLLLFFRQRHALLPPSSSSLLSTWFA